MKRIMTCLLICLSSLQINAQQIIPLTFTHIGLEQGLSQSTVSDIVQDDRGYMWFATHDGLNKYDGYDFTVYRHTPKDMYSLPNDIVRALKIDCTKRL